MVNSLHRSVVTAAVIGLLGYLSIPAAHAQATEARRPNVVIVFADDLGYGDLQSYGHPTIRTPNLDRMAREGIRMTSFYAGAPVCSPSRATLLTGRYGARLGITGALGPDSERGMPASEITLAEGLKDQGYRTAVIGKWHLGDRAEYWPTRHGFDHFFGLLLSNDYMRPWVETDRPLPLYRGTEVAEPHPIEQSTLTQRYTEESVRFIQSAGGEPFFLYLAHAMPHLPLSASERFRGRSRGGLYGDVIEELDWSVGRILQTLEEEGLNENTIIIFTSDNGPWLNAGGRMMQGGIEPWDVGSPGPLRGSKGTTYEAGTRVPFIARWPGRIPAGRESAEIATTMDLYVTLLTAAGAPVPQDRPIDGNDVMPLLMGEVEVSPTQEFYYFAGPRVEAVREGPWKYRLGGGEAAVAELYRLDADPGERHNVAAAYPELAMRLREKMQRFSVDD